MQHAIDHAMALEEYEGKNPSPERATELKTTAAPLGLDE